MERARYMLGAPTRLWKLSASCGAIVADRITVQGIKIPVPRDREVQDFMTPDWHDLIEFYPEFCRHVVSRGEEPWPPQPWMLTICKELVRLKAREGRDADRWMKRMIHHFGLNWLADKVEQMSAARSEAMGEDEDG